MRVISNKALILFAAQHPAAEAPLQAWRQIIQSAQAPDFGGLKRCFNSVDKVGPYYVFNIGGNKYRLVAACHFDRQMVFIRHVFTHKEYDKWEP
jgi:mRNA interferase HigB